MSLNITTGKNKVYFGGNEIYLSRDGMPSAYLGLEQVYGGYDWFDGMLIGLKPTSIISGEGRTTVHIRQDIPVLPTASEPGFSNYITVDGLPQADFTSSVAYQPSFGTYYDEYELTTGTNVINFPSATYGYTDGQYHSFPAKGYNWGSSGFEDWEVTGDFISITGSGVSFLFHFYLIPGKNALTFVGRTGAAVTDWGTRAILNGGPYFDNVGAPVTGSSYDMILGFVPSGSDYDKNNYNFGYNYIEAGFSTETITVPITASDWDGWNSIAMTYDNDSQLLSLYKGETLITSSVLSYGNYSHTAATNDYFVVGKGTGNSGYFAAGNDQLGFTSGSYDGIGLWNRALHPEEVAFWAANYSASRAAL